ncbi:HAD domain-containing protein [Roseateles chitosanitabidus]|uniref:HAD domain-containing protein n=1 Tax=Roseateles chitosanitabidus TaxID=65048 RepID=UPI00082B93F4|nr:HAD domain-containing protein [Roseateles chitosanitabidus]
MKSTVDGGAIVKAPASPLLFLDLDDVLALNTHYNGRDAARAVNQPAKVPADFHERLFARHAVAALNQLMSEFRPRVVLATSWLRLVERNGFLSLFELGGVRIGAADLHPVWGTPELYGLGRGASIQRWFAKHSRGESFLILDDECSGATLVETQWMRQGHVLLCREGVGFHDGLLEAARAAIRTPFGPRSVWNPLSRPR